MGRRITYVVESKFGAISRAMLVTTSREKAVQYYHTHKRAAFIQKHQGGRYGITCGILQPCVPKKIRFRGKSYSRAYVGPHTKRQAQALAKDFRVGPGPRLRSVAKRMKKGWFVYTGSKRSR